MDPRLRGGDGGGGGDGRGGSDGGGGGGDVCSVVEVELLRQLRVFQLLQGLPERLRAVGGFGLLFDGGVDRPALFGDLGQVAHAGAGDQDGGAGLLQAGVDVGLEIAAFRGGGLFRQLLAQQAAQVGEHPADAGVVELAGDGG